MFVHIHSCVFYNSNQKLYKQGSGSRFHKILCNVLISNFTLQGLISTLGMILKMKTTMKIWTCRYLASQ